MCSLKIRTQSQFFVNLSTDHALVKNREIKYKFIHVFSKEQFEIQRYNKMGSLLPVTIESTLITNFTMM